jgi:hypothetical protein
MTSYEDVIEQDDVNLLLTLRDKNTQAQFMVGDLANKYVNKRDIYGVSKSFCYSAIGSYYGKQSRTIRDYSRVAEFYPKNIRNEYPILSFDHYRVAMRSEDWKAVLEWAISSLDGRPQTVDACIAEFNIKNIADPDSLDDVLQPLRKYIVRLPHSIRQIVEAMLEDLEDMIKDALKT